jgi:hypothetical protein
VSDHTALLAEAARYFDDGKLPGPASVIYRLAKALAAEQDKLGLAEAAITWATLRLKCGDPEEALDYLTCDRSELVALPEDKRGRG